MTLALSVRQPWAWAIVAGHKTVENRTWQTEYRGPLLIHASSRLDVVGFEVIRDNRITPPELDALARGALIGRVDLVDITRRSRSRWAIPGQFHFILANPLTFREPIPYTGRLFLFDVS